MKPFLLALMVAWAASAETPFTLTTLDGRSFRDCVLVRVHPDALSFRHATGAARVAFEELDPALRARFGYDPQRAENYRRQLVAVQDEAEQRRQQRDRELSEALAVAQQAEVERLRLEAEQVRAMPASAAASVVPVLPPLGEVHTAGSGWRRAETYYWGQPWHGWGVWGCNGLPHGMRGAVVGGYGGVRLRVGWW
jgi:murein DD-endopeptidase MepM/ murein hydrolase activator NlpD